MIAHLNTIIAVSISNALSEEICMYKQKKVVLLSLAWMHCCCDIEIRLCEFFVIISVYHFNSYPIVAI
jgi:hypothetical protein